MLTETLYNELNTLISMHSMEIKEFIDECMETVKAKAIAANTTLDNDDHPKGYGDQDAATEAFLIYIRD